jgi:hypothetical protein
MKLPTFRRDAASGLAKAQAALAAAEQRITELEVDRRAALAESDAIEPVAALDRQIAEQRAAAIVFADRVEVLKAAVAEQREDEYRHQYAEALGKIEKRLTEEVEKAKRIEQLVRDLGKEWNEMKPHGADDLDARGRPPMCRQSSRPSLGGEAGGRSLGFISLIFSLQVHGGGKRRAGTKLSVLAPRSKPWLSHA